MENTSTLAVDNAALRSADKRSHSIPALANMQSAPATGGQKEKTRNDYAELKRRIKDAGLFELQPRYYTIKFTYTLAMLAAGVAALFLTDNFWLRAADILYMAIVFAQLGFIGHDLGHRQVWASARTHQIAGLFIGNLLMGMSLDWWTAKHNAHHANPNIDDVDPDLNIPGIAWSSDYLENSGPVRRWFARYQAFYFFPMMVLAGIDFQLSSIRHMFAPKVERRWAEASMLVLHHILYYGGLIWLLGGWPGVVFVAAHQALLGVMLGSVFAPNHKGMEILDKNTTLDFLRKQVLTARNVKGHMITDWMYGGLNYQIEHHLVPSIPRNRLPEAQRITREYCEEIGVRYHETSVLGSFREILVCLDEVGAPLRSAPRNAETA